MSSTVNTADSERTRHAVRAAHLYYLQDLTMEAIARELHTSRSSVSRLLNFARETGLVTIRVRSPLDIPGTLEVAIQNRYGITAHVVPVDEGASDFDRLERVAHAAARSLGHYFDSNMTMGIAWGTTISAVSRHLAPKQTHNSQILQLNGAGNARTTGILYVSEILRRFGEAYGAQVHQLPVSAFFDDPATRAAYWRERSVQRLLERQSQMDIALFGIGSPAAEAASHVHAAGYLEEDDYRALHREGVVGDVATVFFRADGSTHGIALNARGTGPDFTALRHTPRRICVVAGTARVAGLRGALAAQLVTDLYLDEGTARALVGPA